MKALRIASIALHLLLVLAQAATNDVLVLRSGLEWHGHIVQETRDGYLFSHHEGGEARMKRIPRNAVQWALYADPATAARNLDIANLRRNLMPGSAETVSARLLPTDDFIATLHENVRHTRSNILLTAYLLVDTPSPDIARFWNTLIEKRREDVEVRLLAEYGPGTSSFIKQSTIQMARRLAGEGIEVRLHTGRKVLHKKIVVLDGERVILGSSNLTDAGTRRSNEMNVSISCRGIAADATRDFEQLWEQAHHLEKIEF